MKLLKIEYFLNKDEFNIILANKFECISSKIFLHSPCVVGMLWEVTDVDTDVLTSDFISYWIPSEAPVHWRYVDKLKWKKAEEKSKYIT